MVKENQEKRKPKLDQNFDLNEEDKQLKEELELLVDRLKSTDNSLYASALETMKTIIKSSTSSMTSVPKPLKFLLPHYDSLKLSYEIIMGEDKKLLADILSILAMTFDNKKLESLRYRVAGTLKDSLDSWGHEYIRHLSAEISDAFSSKEETEDEKIPEDVLFRLVEEIVPYNINHNAEAEACDLVIEIGYLNLLLKYVNNQNYQRVCAYLLNCINYVTEVDEKALLNIVLDIYTKVEQTVEAFQIAIRLNDRKLCTNIFETEKRKE